MAIYPARWPSTRSKTLPQTVPRSGSSLPWHREGASTSSGRGTPKSSCFHGTPRAKQKQERAVSNIVQLNDDRRELILILLASKRAAHVDDSAVTHVISATNPEQLGQVRSCHTRSNDVLRTLAQQFKTLHSHWTPRAPPPVAVVLESGRRPADAWHTVRRKRRVYAKLTCVRQPPCNHF